MTLIAERPRTRRGRGGSARFFAPDVFMVIILAAVGAAWLVVNSIRPSSPWTGPADPGTISMEHYSEADASTMVAFVSTIQRYEELEGGLRNAYGQLAFADNKSFLEYCRNAIPALDAVAHEAGNLAANFESQELARLSDVIARDMIAVVSSAQQLEATVRQGIPESSSYSFDSLASNGAQVTRDVRTLADLLRTPGDAR